MFEGQIDSLRLAASILESIDVNRVLQTGEKFQDERSVNVF